MNAKEYAIKERKSVEDKYVVLKDNIKAKEIVLKLKEYFIDGMYADERYHSYFIKLNMKTKVLIDSLLEYSRNYILDSTLTYPNVGMSLDIHDLVNIFDPTN